MSVWDKLKCAFCELKLDSHFIIYNQKKYHKHCFKCLECGLPINEDPFIMKGDRPLCMTCMAKNQLMNAKTCVKCHQKIRGASILFDDKNYHINCFKCSECDKRIIKFKLNLKNIYLNIFDHFKGIEEKRFLTKNKLPICRKCADRNQFKCNIGEKHCHKCNKQIQMGTKYLTNRDHNKFFHSECFTCKECLKVIPSGDPFYNSGDDKQIAVCIDCGDKMITNK